MPEIAVSALDGRQRALVDNARAALVHGQDAYAIEACTAVLREAPGCHAVRRLLWEAQLMRMRRRTAPERWCRATVAWLLSCSLSARSPERRLQRAARVLDWNPASVSGLLRLARAADAMGWRGTVVFACEAVRQLAPENHHHALALSRALLAGGEPERALALANDVLAQRLLDPAAQELVRAASVAVTMARGHWDTAGSFRGKLAQSPPGEPIANAEPAERHPG